MPKEMRPIIELEGVTAGAGDRYTVGITNVSLCLVSGDAAVLTVPKTRPSTPLFDLCCGLKNPISGVVRFLGESWSKRNPAQVSQDRGRIGRVWFDSAWVGNLDIDENILLPQLHHTRRALSELREQAETLARTLGLDDLPQTRPAWTSEKIRRKAQWVRALMGTPDLLLLEYPDDDVEAEDCARLVTAVDQARTQGAAVLWITASHRPALTDLPSVVSHAKLIGTELIWHPVKTGMLNTPKG